MTRRGEAPCESRNDAHECRRSWRRTRVAQPGRPSAVSTESTPTRAPMSCPVSSCHRLLILIEDPLQRAVVGRVVDGVVLPAAPDDVDPGAGQDADGVLVVAFP